MSKRLTDDRVLEMLRQVVWVRDNASGWSFDSDEIRDFVSLLEEVLEQRKLIDQIATKTVTEIQGRIDSLSAAALITLLWLLLR